MADIFVSKARLATFWQGIKSKLADKSDVGHKHSAADLTSGILAVSRGGTGYSSVDTTPTNGSAKMVTSGGIYTALAAKANNEDLQIDEAELETMLAEELGVLSSASEPVAVASMDYVQELIGGVENGTY